MCTPPRKPKLLVSMDLVEVEISALLGLDMFDRESITPCTVSNRLIKRLPVEKNGGEFKIFDQWYTTLRRSLSGLLYAEMSFPHSIYFTRTQVSKIHRQFFHPSAAKLFKLIQIARPEHDTLNT